MRPFSKGLVFESAGIELHVKTEDCGHAIGLAFKRTGKASGWAGMVLNEEDVDKLVAYLSKDKKADAA